MLRLKDSSLDSNLSGILLVDSRGEDNLDAHVLQRLNRSPVLGHVLLLVENADGLHTKVVN